MIDKTRTIEHVAEDGLCFGCGTCEAACPKEAIHMQMIPSLGSYRPIMGEACTNCGICKQCCPGCGINCTDSSQQLTKDHIHHQLFAVSH